MAACRPSRDLHLAAQSNSTGHSAAAYVIDCKGCHRRCDLAGLLVKTKSMSDLSSTDRLVNGIRPLVDLSLAP